MGEVGSGEFSLYEAFRRRQVALNPSKKRIENVAPALIADDLFSALNK
jgi:hypothetical protein